MVEILFQEVRMVVHHFLLAILFIHDGMYNVLHHITLICIVVIKVHTSFNLNNNNVICVWILYYQGQSKTFRIDTCHL